MILKIIFRERIRKTPCAVTDEESQFSVPAEIDLDDIAVEFQKQTQKSRQKPRSERFTRSDSVRSNINADDNYNSHRPSLVTSVTSPNLALPNGTSSDSVTEDREREQEGFPNG